MSDQQLPEDAAQSARRHAFLGLLDAYEIAKEPGAREIITQEIRRKIMLEGLPNETKEDVTVLTKGNADRVLRPTLRGRVWKMLLGISVSDPELYISLVEKGESKVYGKIRLDTTRTLKGDEKFSERVDEGMLVRVLNSAAHYFQMNGINIDYVQGMNVLLAPLLFVMPEVDAFYSFVTLCSKLCPKYVEANMTGVGRGCRLLEEALKIFDPPLFKKLMQQERGGEVYHFRSISSLCCCFPPLQEVVKVWDVLMAFGLHLNVLFVVARLLIMRKEILESNKNSWVVWTPKTLEASPLVPLVIQMAREMSDHLYLQLVEHTYI